MSVCMKPNTAISDSEIRHLNVGQLLLSHSVCLVQLLEILYEFKHPGRGCQPAGHCRVFLPLQICQKFLAGLTHKLSSEGQTVPLAKVINKPELTESQEKALKTVYPEAVI